MKSNKNGKLAFNPDQELIYIAYPRVSTDEQRDGNSIDLQTEKILSWAKAQKQPMRLYAVLDEDESGFKLDRPRIREIIKLAKRKEINAVVVSKMDRFARDRNVSTTLSKLFGNLGLRLFSVQEGEFTPGTMNVVVQAVHEALGEQNATVAKQTMRDSRHGYIDKGAVQGQGVAPYGYMKEGKKENTVFVIIEEQAAVIRYIFVLYISRIPLPKIADILNSEGIPHPQAAKGLNSRYTTTGWSRDTVRHVIHNMDKYHGTHLAYTRSIYRDVDEKVTVSIPQIIDDNVYEQARYIYDGTRTAFFDGILDQRIFLLGGRTTCGCGYSINKQVIKNRGRIYDYYRCLTSFRKNNASECGGNYFPAVPAETVVWNFIAELIADPKAAIEKHKQRQSDTVDEVQVQLDYLAAIKASIDDLERTFAIDEDMYKRAVRKLDKNRASDIDLIERAEQVYQAAYDDYVEKVRHFKELEIAGAAALAQAEISGNQMKQLEEIAAQLRSVLDGDVTPEKQRQALDLLRTKITAIRVDEYHIILIIMVLGQTAAEGEKRELTLSNAVSGSGNTASNVPHGTNGIVFRLTLDLRQYTSRAR